jgi:hypothetical protein
MPELAQQREPQAFSSPLVAQLVNTHLNLRMACSVLLLGASLATSGCLFGSSKKKAKVFTPPPVYSTAPAPPVNPKPVVLTPPLDVEAEVEPDPDLVVVGGNLPPAPVKPLPPKTTPAKPAPTVVEVTPPPVVAPPKLATIFSAAERQQMNQEIDQSLGKVRTALARVEGKTLAPDLNTLANNARAQMMNAEQTRVQDLVTAVSLAKRAESFATELVRRLP